MLFQNPCLTCGACCAFFRVSFYWGEADDSPGGAVPVELTEDLTGFRRCMRGTNQKHPRCTALEGAIGQAVSCAIYDRRPTPCHEFGLHWENGVLVLNAGELERCNAVRLACGLPPLLEQISQPSDPQGPFGQPSDPGEQTKIS